MIQNKKVYTITGSIATGKSFVSDIIRNYGYYVIDADKIGHDVLNNKDVIEDIISTFSKDFVKNGKVDREKLSEFLFSHKERIKDINKITHKKIISEINDNIKKCDDDIIFVDMPLYFEIKENLEDYGYKTDGVILIYSNLETQILRLMKRDGIDKDYALKKISSQMSIDEKKKLSDYVIDNSYDLYFLEKQINIFMEKIKNSK